MNKVTLIGRVATDIDVKKTQGGHAVAQFRVAVQRRFANQQGVREADFIPIVAWRNLGELCHKYLSKGKRVAVSGALQTRSYDAQDGTKRYVTEVIADEVEFLTPSAKSAEGAPAGGEEGFTVIDDDELPF